MVVLGFGFWVLGFEFWVLIVCVCDIHANRAVCRCRIQNLHKLSQHSSERRTQQGLMHKIIADNLFHTADSTGETSSLGANWRPIGEGRGGGGGC